MLCMIEYRWKIDISKTLDEIVQQVISIVEEMDDLGVFDATLPPDANNDN